MPNAVFLSFLRKETDGILWFLYYKQERLIGRIYGRVLRVSLMFCNDGIEDVLD
jgi:hypothetical protein